ncbi:MAG TPA: hypothetical protein VFS90_07595 [Pyrinomonadaceae bacterium]|nr:hypothetical protein [Pyrinomonadaceae bacterium]
MKKLYIPLLLIMIAISARAQTSSVQTVIANIPFEFSAGKTTLPAGKYTITVLNPASDRKSLQIRSLDGRAIAIVLTTTRKGNLSDSAKLVFERFGDRYVFAQAQMAGDATGLSIVRRKEHGEKQIAKAKKSVIVIHAE